MKKEVIIVSVLVVILTIVLILSINYSLIPKTIRIKSIEITNVYRNCEKDSLGNYVDTTIQATANIKIVRNIKFSKMMTKDDCILKIGETEVEGFSLNIIPTPKPYIERINESGTYRITGGELNGDVSDVLTFCCQNQCDVADIVSCY